MIPEHIREKILAEYDQNLGQFTDFGRSAKSLLVTAIKNSELTVHSVSMRIKQRESLSGKLVRPEKSYQRLSDLTDVCGIRVITHFDDDVSKVGGIIQRAFEVDTANSVDKTAALGADKFGYRSVHYVVGHTQNRTKLIEYSKFSGMKTEIQVRSILQHAWAEIEHELRYKGDDVPTEINRRFARLSGLLELADQEFRNIKGDIFSLKKKIASQIQNSPGKVGLSAVSLSEFSKTSRVMSIDHRIANIAGKPYQEAHEFDESIAKRFEFCGIDTIEKLTQAFIDNRDIIINFAAVALRESPSPAYLRAGYSVLVLSVVYALINLPKAKLEQYADVAFRTANTATALESVTEIFQKARQRAKGDQV